MESMATRNTLMVEGMRGFNTPKPVELVTTTLDMTHQLNDGSNVRDLLRSVLADILSVHVG